MVLHWPVCERGLPGKGGEGRGETPPLASHSLGHSKIIPNELDSVPSHQLPWQDITTIKHTSTYTMSSSDMIENLCVVMEKLTQPEEDAHEVQMED